MFRSATSFSSLVRNASRRSVRSRALKYSDCVSHHARTLSVGFACPALSEAAVTKTDRVHFQDFLLTDAVDKFWQVPPTRKRRSCIHQARGYILGANGRRNCTGYAAITPLSIVMIANRRFSMSSFSLASFARNICAACAGVSLEIRSPWLHTAKDELQQENEYFN